MVTIRAAGLDAAETEAVHDIGVVVAACGALLRHDLTGADWPPATKALKGDDQQTEPLQMTHWLLTTVVNALEHVHALGRMIGLPNEVVLQRGPSYTAVRGAMESAVSVWWVLHPNKRKERVSRRVRLWRVSQRYEDEALGHLIASLGDRVSTKERAAEVKRQGDYDARWGRHLKRFEAYVGQPIGSSAKFTQMFRQYDASQVEDSPCTLGWWEVAAGFAHGYEWAPRRFHELDDVTSIGGGVSTAVSTARFVTVNRCLEAAAVILLEALRRIDWLAGSPGQGIGAQFGQYLRGARETMASTPPQPGMVQVPVLN